jgi:arylsulfatase A-like enzyme
MAAPSRPNVLIILTDDQGYGDLSCMGATDVQTPHLDRLAQAGVRFTSWYAASPVCSPSRAGLLTGRYPAHAGVRAILGGRRTTPGLSPEVPTLSSELHRFGYRTAFYGKWHLGLSPECRPEAHGFETWMGFMAGCIDYYSHIYYWGQDGGLNPVHDLWHDSHEFYANGQYFTEMVTDHAVRYIRQAATEAAPFFLYVAYNAPHYPMHAPQQYLDRFPDLPWDRQIMSAMLSAVDDGVGAICEELERQGIWENTWIFFQSDNGPSRESRNWLDGRADPYYGGTTGRLKGHKFSLYEGGIRVPGIMTWPARIPADQVIEAPAMAVDLFPTILSAVGGDASAYACDGYDILPLVTTGVASPRPAIFWEMGEQTAMRQGPWKLVLQGQLEEGAPAEDRVHLSNLEEDLGEGTNLAETYPDLTESLKEAALRWRASIEAGDIG